MYKQLSLYAAMLISCLSYGEARYTNMITIDNTTNYSAYIETRHHDHYGKPIIPLMSINDNLANEPKSSYTVEVPEGELFYFLTGYETAFISEIQKSYLIDDSGRTLPCFSNPQSIQAGVPFKISNFIITVKGKDDQCQLSRIQ